MVCLALISTVIASINVIKKTTPQANAINSPNVRYVLPPFGSYKSYNKHKLATYLFSGKLETTSNETFKYKEPIISDLIINSL